MRKDKHSAKGFGARSVRRDGEQITTWTYFKRIVSLVSGLAVHVESSIRSTPQCAERQLSMEFWPTLVAAVTCLVITQGLQIFAPNVQGSIFDGILAYLKNPEGGRSKFEYAMLTYVIINILQGCFSGLKALAQELVQRRMACSVRLKLFASVVRMDISFFDTMHTGQLTSRLTNDASNLDQRFSDGLVTLVPSGCSGCPSQLLLGWFGHSSIRFPVSSGSKQSCCETMTVVTRRRWLYHQQMRAKACLQHIDLSEACSY